MVYCHACRASLTPDPVTLTQAASVMDAHAKAEPTHGTETRKWNSR